MRRSANTSVQLRRKLRSRRGETMMETLVAIAMILLSSAVMLTMILAAGRANARAAARDQQLYQAISQAEVGRETGGTASLAVTVNGSAVDGSPLTVKLCGDGDSSDGLLWSYRYEKEGGGS